MNHAALETIHPLWQKLVESNARFSGAVGDFLTPAVDRVTSVRHGLWTAGLERATALQVFPYLPPEEQWQLYPDLVFLASSAHGSIGVVRELLLALPRDRVLTTIEGEAERYLRDGTYDEFRRFLELYSLLSQELTSTLARRAASHEDADIQEAGQDFLAKVAGA